MRGAIGSGGRIGRNVGTRSRSREKERDKFGAHRPAVRLVGVRARRSRRRPRLRLVRIVLELRVLGRWQAVSRVRADAGHRYRARHSALGEERRVHERLRLRRRRLVRRRRLRAWHRHVLVRARRALLAASAARASVRVRGGQRGTRRGRRRCGEIARGLHVFGPPDAVWSSRLRLSVHSVLQRNSNPARVICARTRRKALLTCDKEKQKLMNSTFQYSLLVH